MSWVVTYITTSGRPGGPLIQCDTAPAAGQLANFLATWPGQAHWTDAASRTGPQGPARTAGRRAAARRVADRHRAGGGRPAHADDHAGAQVAPRPHRVGGG